MSDGIDDKSKSDTIDGLNYAKEVVAQRVNLPHRFENIFKDVSIYYYIYVLYFNLGKYMCIANQSL